MTKEKSRNGKARCSFYPECFPPSQWFVAFRIMIMYCYHDYVLLCDNSDCIFLC